MHDRRRHTAGVFQDYIWVDVSCIDLSQCKISDELEMKGTFCLGWLGRDLGCEFVQIREPRGSVRS